MKELHLTVDWPFERVAAYGPQITAAMLKLCAKFPYDATVKSLFHDIAGGAVQLWLMLDGETFKGIVLTDIKTVPATGHKAVRIIGLAGEDGQELTPNIAAIEKWAWEQGADEVTPVGRAGWKKSLGALGYTVDRVIYRKARPA